ncbi:helix-turn-helix transcriptional regulator [Clostridium botulinum]|nr:helix-turn-helix transcriptional regulator [Clostridium botulinum]NFH69063.1 helix-turn-helix transcriptional regulator [Clostridium botulinum]NFP00060.1 helix-turn-helix transcriptional regulator [Clostridium botulinum]
MIILNLRVLMAKKKINMQQLSEETGIRRATISAYYNETYRHLVKDHLNIFCRYFNCNISDLIEFVEDEDK